MPETHELLTVAMQDYTMSTEYPASIQGNQDIKIIPRVEGYLQGVHVKEGDAVKTGDQILILEAMKMEIPVVAPKDGTVSKIVVSEGEATTSGQTVAYVE